MKICLNKISDVNRRLERCDLIITRSFAGRAKNYSKLRLGSSCRLYVLPHDTGHLTLLIKQILAEFNTVTISGRVQYCHNFWQSSILSQILAEFNTVINSGRVQYCHKFWQSSILSQILAEFNTVTNSGRVQYCHKFRQSSILS